VTTEAALRPRVGRRHTGWHGSPVALENPARFLVLIRSAVHEAEQAAFDLVIAQRPAIHGLGQRRARLPYGVTGRRGRVNGGESSLAINAAYRIGRLLVIRRFCHFWNNCGITANLCRLSFVNLMQCAVR
jgi:hypothetical protein